MSDDGANVLALTAPVAHDGALNIASGHPITVLEVASAIAGGSEPALAPVVTGVLSPRRLRHVVASPQRARDVLAFRAAIEPMPGLAAFADAPLRHPLAGAWCTTPSG